MELVRFYSRIYIYISYRYIGLTILTVENRVELTLKTCLNIIIYIYIYVCVCVCVCGAWGIVVFKALRH